MNNIFENSYFGKPYKTRDNKKALYAKKDESGMHYLIPNDYCDTISYLSDGTVWNINKEHNLDIISEWTVNEEKLDKQAVCWNNLSEKEKSNIMLDIVSSRKPIDEEELDKLALEYFNKQWCTNYQSIDDITDELDLQAIDDFKAGFLVSCNLYKASIDEEELDTKARTAYKHSAFDIHNGWEEAVYCTGYKEGFREAMK